MNVAFFGCWEQAGHFLHDASGRNLQSFGPFIPESLDTVFIRDEGRPREAGFTTITCFKDYTVMAFWDNTVDRRPGSNGAFIIEAPALNRRECWEAAEKVFPQIVKRLEGRVRGARAADRHLGG
jgi:hypothetical protein